MELDFIVSDQTEPYWNIAVEQYLVEYARCVTLYLWKNRRTVVIGQNQNPYSEVDIEALEAEGGYLMRRRTGGGAVYHDEGNLNFSFVVPKNLYDQTRQFAVIQRAVESFGLHTELSGRNDILAEGRKFSGNAFSKGRINDLHHGTLLIDGNMDELQHYLRPKPAKLLKHGVQSVRSRVVNLSGLNPAITTESIVPALRKAFESEYSEDSEYSEYSDILRLPQVQHLHDSFASAEWKYGHWKTFTAQRRGQFDWGEVEVALTVDDGIVSDVQIASDTIDVDAVTSVKKLLLGSNANSRPASVGNKVVDDILSLIS